MMMFFQIFSGVSGSSTSRAFSRAASLTMFIALRVCFSQAVLLEARAKSSEFLEHAFKPGDAELNAVSHGLSGTQSW
ncbi:hypothetical protein P4M26_24605 [Pseudomonas aeruginosa]|nr:hypothetical protein [Pseudomonas aeruginosa]